jgi:hypothetical protein
VLCSLTPSSGQHGHHAWRTVRADRRVRERADGAGVPGAPEQNVSTGLPSWRRGRPAGSITLQRRFEPPTRRSRRAVDELLGGTRQRVVVALGVQGEVRSARLLAATRSGRPGRRACLLRPCRLAGLDCAYIRTRSASRTALSGAVTGLHGTPPSPCSAHRCWSVRRRRRRNSSHSWTCSASRAHALVAGLPAVSRARRPRAGTRTA